MMDTTPFIVAYLRLVSTCILFGVQMPSARYLMGSIFSAWVYLLIMMINFNRNHEAALQGSH